MNDFSLRTTFRHPQVSLNSSFFFKNETLNRKTKRKKAINGMNPGASPGPGFRGKPRGIYRE